MTSMHRHTLNLPGKLSGVHSSPLARAVVPAPEPLPEPPKAAEDRTWLDLRAAFDAAVLEARAWRHDVREELSRTSVSLAIAIAERLLENEIAADRQRLDKIVERCLERFQSARPVTVRGHADDLALLQRQFDSHNLLGAPGEEMLMRADPVLQRGQLKLETDDWFLEFDTKRSLAELHDLLQETIVTDD